MLNSASSVIFLLVVGPVAVLSLPNGIFSSISASTAPPRYHMKDLSGNNTNCPFTVNITKTGGEPQFITEYRCKTPSTSSDSGFSEKGQCVQGTVKIMVKMPNIPEPQPMNFSSGCFFYIKKGTVPNSATRPLQKKLKFPN
ncbi:uncharacterized protein LOC120351254 [Nilaparvata lugens]|uniref:uncharacterized protein LOC120351254 n=1 Tax=Nilaparvata lugens TaxID=108931 RepID=UPI00193D3535|nr:uncharacterized protein LOC120351254 [Nilaparvata lugens]